MAMLSKRVVRIALFASVASLVSSYAASTLAQLPIYQLEPEPGVSPAAEDALPEAAPTPPSAVAPPSAATPGTAPAAPLPPNLLSSRTPPAKAEVITEPRRGPDDEAAEED